MGNSHLSIYFLSYFKLSFTTNYLTLVIVSHEKQTLLQTLGNTNRHSSFFLWQHTLGLWVEGNKPKNNTITAVINSVGLLKRITVVQMQEWNNEEVGVFLSQQSLSPSLGTIAGCGSGDAETDRDPTQLRPCRSRVSLPFQTSSKWLKLLLQSWL